MTFRNDLDAAVARAEALAGETERLEKENEALRKRLEAGPRLGRVSSRTLPAMALVIGLMAVALVFIPMVLEAPTDREIPQGEDKQEVVPAPLCAVASPSVCDEPGERLRVEHAWVVRTDSWYVCACPTPGGVRLYTIRRER